MDRLRMAKVSLASAGMQSKIIHSDDFCQFVREHGRAAVGRRLTSDALWFIQDYVFPPSHADLLSVRGTYTRSPNRTVSSRVHLLVLALSICLAPNSR